MKQFWERLKAMPTWQKVLLGMAVVGVVGFALYMRQKNSQAQTTPTTLSSGLLNGVDTYGNPLYNNGYSGLPGGGSVTSTPGAGGISTTTVPPPTFIGPPQRVPQWVTVGKETQANTFASIASQYGRSTQQLLALNSTSGVTDPNAPLYSGFVVKLY